MVGGVEVRVVLIKSTIVNHLSSPEITLHVSNRLAKIKKRLALI